MVLRRYDIFSTEWQQSLKHIPEMGMIGEITIYDPNVTGGTYDPVTNTWVGASSAVYSGKARVQPLRSAVPRVIPGDSTTVQTVLVSIPGTALSVPLKPTYRGRVTGAGLNPDLLRYEFRVKELMDSTNPLERTLLFEVNQETASP